MKIFDTLRRSAAAGKVFWLLLLVLLLSAATACSLDLGAVPFKCNSGTPKCPGGYECTGGYCVKEGTCPDSVPGCVNETSCGDDSCDTDETPASCPEDCPAEPSCGNGSCESGEDAAGCPEDCAEATCGNDACEAGETSTSCPEDCATSSCGNDTCDSGETTASCPEDCPAGPTCGDNTCDSGETTASCPVDCPAGPICGDSSCDSGETALSCPQDCGCQDGQTKCAGDESLEVCEAGQWGTDLCATVCAAEGFDYSVGCGYSSTYSKDVCKCSDYVPFGGLCNDDLKCETGFFCAYFSSGIDGYCTKYCSNPGGECSGAPEWTLAMCSIQVGGKDACVFDCSDWYYDCPDDLGCDIWTSYCKP